MWDSITFWSFPWSRTFSHYKSWKCHVLAPQAFLCREDTDSWLNVIERILNQELMMSRKGVCSESSLAAAVLNLEWQMLGVVPSPLPAGSANRATRADSSSVLPIGRAGISSGFGGSKHACVAPWRFYELRSILLISFLPA